MKKLLPLLFLMSSLAQAADPGGTYFKLGLGLNEPLTATKSLFLGFQGPIKSIFIWQAEVGGYYAYLQQPDFIGMASGSLGISISNPYVYGKLLFGPALMTNTDSRLGSIFEFNDDAEFGIRDRQGYAIGLNYKHISNAGLTPGNGGRNFLMIKVQVPF